MVGLGSQVAATIGWSANCQMSGAHVIHEGLQRCTCANDPAVSCSLLRMASCSPTMARHRLRFSASLSAGASGCTVMLPDP